MNKLHFKYTLANLAGYKFNIVKIDSNVYDPSAYYHKENFPDVEITRPTIPTDLFLLHDKCLLTVNGYIYPTEYHNERLYIPKATISMLKSKSNAIGILSFNNLSDKLIKYKITPDMITSEIPFGLYEKAIITLGSPVRSPILVICGYMFFEDDEIFYRASETSFVIRIDKLLYIERLYELNRYTDIFSRLEIPVSHSNPSVIDYDVAKSDSAIINFLTEFNSFIVDVPVENLHAKKIYLEHSTVPGSFRTELKPELPIIIGYGKIAEYYKKQTNDFKYNVYINDAYYNNHLFTKTASNLVKILNDHRVVGQTYELSEAFFLDIYTNV
jgi:hypothetical protein